MSMVLLDLPKNSAKSRIRLAWIVNITAALFFFYEFIQLNLFNAINTELMQDFSLNAVQLGQLASMYFYANALFLFPAGNLLDRYSTKKMLLFAVTLCTIGTFIFALATSYEFAAFGRFLVGAGASFCFLSCIRLASRWFPPERMAFVTGVVVTMAMLGGLVAQTPLTLLTHYLGDWRQAVLLNAFLGILIAFLILLIVQDRPEGTQQAKSHDRAHLQRLGLWRCIKLAALNPQNWLGGLYTALMNLPVFILGSLWGMRYLVEVRGITNVEASYATTVFFLGVIAGSLAFGWFSDHIGRRVLPMVIGALASLGVILILMYVPNLHFGILVCLFFAIGFTTSSQVLSYPTLAELNPLYLTSTAISIDSVIIMCSGFVSLPFFGWLMAHGGTQHLIENVPVYSVADFNRAMLMIPIAFVISLLITLFIRETYCKSQA